MLLPFGWSWMEKEPFVPSPPEAFAGSGQLPPHANGADTQVENELCVAGSGQARLPTPPGSRETCIPPLFTSGKHRGTISPQNVIALGVLLAWHTSPLPLDKAVPQKMKDVCWRTSSFLPLLLLQKLLT